MDAKDQARRVVQEWLTAEPDEDANDLVDRLTPIFERVASADDFIPKMRDRAERAEAAIAATVGMTDRETLQWWGRYANDETMKLRKAEAAVRRLREVVSALFNDPLLVVPPAYATACQRIREALAATEPTP